MNNIKNSILPITVTIILIIEISQFINMGLYADEYSASPAAMLGGEFWLNMSWVKLFLLLGLPFLLGIRKQK